MTEEKKTISIISSENYGIGGLIGFNTDVSGIKKAGFYRINDKILNAESPGDYKEWCYTITFERELFAPSPFPLRPLEDLVFVKRTAKETMFGSLHVPDTNDDSPKTSGEIMAVGPGKFSETLGRVIQPRVEVGQKVVFSRHANMAIDIEGIIPKDGEEYLVMHADELIAVITGEGGASLAPEPALKVS